MQYPEHQHHGLELNANRLSRLTSRSRFPVTARGQALHHHILDWTESAWWDSARYVRCSGSSMSPPCRPTRPEAPRLPPRSIRIAQRPVPRGSGVYPGVVPSTTRVAAESHALPVRTNAVPPVRSGHELPGPNSRGRFIYWDYVSIQGTSDCI